MYTKLVLAVLVVVSLKSAIADDTRQIVNFPDPMREHMLGNMRDHLLALEEITRQLANQNYDDAAAIAESRLGMSSLDDHGASHIAKFMPEEMQAIGTSMHHAASRFAISAQDAELDGGLNKAFSALSEVMQQCVACHSAYRVH